MPGAWRNGKRILQMGETPQQENETRTSSGRNQNNIRRANLKEKQYDPKQLKLYTDSMIERVIKNRDVGILKLVFIGGSVYLNGLIRLANKKIRGHSDVI